MAKPKKPKPVLVELIAREEEGKVHQTYKIMDKLIAAHHGHLSYAKIAIAWRKGLKPDVDDKLVLGKCRKSSDLDRELHGFDFVILLNFEKWNAAEFSAKEMEALLDHELMHAAESVDENGDPKVDERGRQVWRIRKHDIEEFREIVERHGLWKGDLEAFAASALKGKRAPLFHKRDVAGSILDVSIDAIESGGPIAERMRPSEGSVTISSGGRSATLHAKDKGPKLATA